MVRTAQHNGHETSYTGVIPSLSTPARWHPVYGPQQPARLRVRPGMVALYLAALALFALLLCGPSQWRWMALGLLPVNLTAIVLHRKPLDPLAAIGSRGRSNLR